MPWIVLVRGQARFSLYRATQHLPIPVAFRILVQGRKHDWQYNVNVIADQVTKVFVVPKIQRALGNLLLISCDFGTVPKG